MPWNGGSSWITASPAATRASAVRIQARNVRSLANVYRASGSCSATAGACSEAALPLASVAASSPAAGPATVSLNIIPPAGARPRCAA